MKRTFRVFADFPNRRVAYAYLNRIVYEKDMQNLPLRAIPSFHSVGKHYLSGETSH